MSDEEVEDEAPIMIVENDDEEIDVFGQEEEEEENEEATIVKSQVAAKTTTVYDAAKAATEKKPPKPRIATQPKTSKQFFRSRGKNPKLYTFTADGDLQVPELDKQPATIIQLPYYHEATPAELEEYDAERKSILSGIDAQYDEKMAQLRAAIADWRVTNRSSTVIELQMQLRILDAQRTALRSPFRWTKLYKNPVKRSLIFENRYDVRRIGYDAYALKTSSYPLDILHKPSIEKPVKTEKQTARAPRPLRAGELPPLFIFKADDLTTGPLSPYSLLTFMFGESKFPSIAHAYEAERLKEFGKSKFYDLFFAKQKDPFVMREKSIQKIVGVPSAPKDLLLKIISQAARRKPFAEALRATGNAPLIFADPKDVVWGVGLSADDVNIENPANWLGQNIYGEALMRVRKEIPEGELVDVVLEGGSLEDKIDLGEEQQKERKRYFIGLSKRKTHFSGH